MEAPRRAAFFDVDETLLTAKSMFDFLRFWLARNGDDGTRYRVLEHERRARASAGVPRAEINRDYYRHYTGADYAEVLVAGRQWYAEYRRRPDAFIGPAVAAATGHRAAGHLVVLVSGSFRACLGPFAADLGAGEILCGEPVVGGDGRLTGEIPRPMIGDTKGAAVAETIRRHGLDPADCYAYADHGSDLTMLTAVGKPTVIGDDEVLAAQAGRHGWPVLPATPVPYWLTHAA